MKEWFNSLIAKITGKNAEQKDNLITTVATVYEINLVPEVKAQMIRAQKMRNLVLYICIMVSVISVSVVLVLFGIKSGQDIAIGSQDKRLGEMSAKLMGYEELGDLVTIQNQLSRLGAIAENKTVLSRVFGALGIMISQGDDYVKLSELRVDLENNNLRMEGQTDARVAPLIDYRVLEAFKKSAALTKYDYGRYVDVNDKEIPTWCMNESDENGNAYRVGESYYAWWDLTAEGCAALPLGETVPEESDIEFFYNDKSEVEVTEQELSYEDLAAAGITVDVDEEGNTKLSDEKIEIRDVEGETKFYRTTVARVKVWRTPQFTAWNNGGLMELDGAISGIEHFKSECTSYSGQMTSGSAVAKWTSTNECYLAPDGLTVTDSSNGRDESDNLVLKFTATMKVEPAFFAFQNKHMIAIGPMGQNVTDSYVQIGNMFTQEARECAENDTECLTNSTNTGGNTQNGN